jgi:hypothetical protein
MSLITTSQHSSLSLSLYYQIVLRLQLEEQEVDVRWSSACEDVSPGANSVH